jgi:hypothetical protein
MKKLYAETEFGKIYDKPFWNNGCRHPKSTYVGSIKNGKQKLDIYIYTDKGSKQVEACIRFGNNINQYHSPGLLKYLLWSGYAGDDICQAALSVLEHFGQITWKRKK